MFEVDRACYTSIMPAGVCFLDAIDINISHTCRRTMQMDEGYMEQFPIGAIDHIGLLPESTLPKEVTRCFLGQAACSAIRIRVM